MTPSLKYEQWYTQSDYDLDVAKSMLDTGRNIYCVFMCHLGLEKALKGLYVKRTTDFPAKTHNLIYFVDKIGLDISDSDMEFLNMLSTLSVPTRYPEDLERLIAAYSKERTVAILQQSKNLQQWIKQQ